MRDSTIVFLAGLLCVVGAALGAAASDSDALSHEIVLARFERLQNLIADYEVTTRYAPTSAPTDPVQKRGTGFVVTNTGTRVTAKQFSVLQDRCMYRANDISWDRGFEHPYLAKIGSLYQSVYVRTSDRVETFSGNDRGPKHNQGSIRQTAPLPKFGGFELCLGLRMWDAPDPLTVKDVEGMALAKTEEGAISLRGLNHNDWANEWVFDPQLGYALVRYRAYLPKSNTVFTEYVMEDFRPVDGLMLPFRVHGVWGLDPNNPRRTETFVVKAYRLNDPNNTPDRYHIDWPEGTRVYDARTGTPFRAGKDTQQ